MAVHYTPVMGVGGDYADVWWAAPGTWRSRVVADAVGAFRHSCAPMHDLTLLALTCKPGA